MNDADTLVSVCQQIKADNKEQRREARPEILYLTDDLKIWDSQIQSVAIGTAFCTGDPRLLNATLSVIQEKDKEINVQPSF
jgi:hypothetical protein